MGTWHEEDQFWEIMAPLMFAEERWAATPEEVDLLLPLLAMDPGGTILDLGCGPGRHSLELARRGFTVTAVDRTRSFLQEAKRRAQEEGLKVEFIHADMRKFTRETSFEGAIMLFTTFGYFADPEENLRVQTNIHRSLKEGGSLVLELMGKEILARIFQPRGWQELEGIIFLEERTVTKDWSWMVNRWIRVDDHGRTEYQVSHWIYSAAELTSMLNTAGFAEVRIYGDLAGSAYDHTAKRLVAVARK